MTTATEAMFTFHSTFRVLRADRLLAPLNLAHGLAPTPDGIASPCGLCVHVPLLYAETARAALVAADNAPEAVYRYTASGWETL